MKPDEKRIVALTGCSHALSHGYLLIFAAVLSLLQKEFSMGYLGVGIMGTVMTLAYGLGALPGGMIYNRLGARRLYLFCFLGSAAACLLVAAAPNFILFTVGLALLGALGSVYHPLANSLITQKVGEYGRALGIHGAAGNAGLAATPLLAGLIASSFGWRQAYVCFAFLGVALSIWSLFIDMSVGKEKTKSPQLVPETKSRNGSFLIFFSLPLILIYVTNMFNAFCFHGTITFLPTYMAKRTSFQVFSLDSVAIGGMLSGIALSLGIVGQYMGGILGQRARLERNILLIALLAFPFMVTMSFTMNILLLAAALVYFFFNFCLQPMCNVLLARHTTPEMRGTAFGIFFFVSSAIGSGAASFSGYIAQTFGLQWVFLGISGVVVLLIVFSLLLWRTEKTRSTLTQDG